MAVTKKLYVDECGVNLSELPFPFNMIVLNPIPMGFLALLLGLLLIVLASVFHILDVKLVVGGSDHVVRQVGYIYAPNWTFVSTILYPISMFAVSVAMKSMFSIHYTLFSRRMIAKVDDLDVLSDVAKMNDIYGDFVGRCRQAFWIAFIGFVSFAVFDYVYSVLLPLIDGLTEAQKMCPISPNDPEVDWSVAHAIDSEKYPLIPGILFGFISYALIPVLETGIIAGFLGCLVALALSFNPKVDKEAYTVIPDVAKLRGAKVGNGLGFEEFRSIFSPMIIVLAASYTSCYFMVVQNYYLKSCYTDIVSFLFSWLPDKIELNYALIALMLHTEPPNVKVVTAIFIVFFVKAICIMTLYWSLREVANKSGRIIRDSIEKDVAPAWIKEVLQINGKTKKLNKAHLSKLSKIDIWPYPEIKANRFFLFIGFFALSIIFYRISIVFAIVATAYIIYKTIKPLSPRIPH